MATETSSAKSVDIRDRVALTDASVTKLSRWCEQLTSAKRGVVVNRKDLVNWLIETHGAELSAGEVETLGARFHDELRFLTQVLKEMKEAKARGECLSLGSLVRVQDAVKSSKRQPNTAGRPAKSSKQALDPKAVSEELQTPGKSI